jgi:hypothetical protein
MSTGPRPPGPISLPKGITWQILQVNGGQLSAVCGESESVEPGVWGTNDAAGVGVLGNSTTGEGVLGEGTNGVHGKSASATDSGVWGENTGGGYGVSGSTSSSFQPGPVVIAGVWGANSGSGCGVKGTSQGGDGVVGASASNGHAGVSAINGGGGYGVWASGTPAGYFEGDVRVTGDVILTNPQGQDCAEDFEVLGAEDIDPGSVVVIDSEGAIKRSDRAYDKRVAGVVSGAGDYKPGIVLGREHLEANRMPVALMGRVFCRVDAQYSPIEVGDLLTTSPTPGYAMKAEDQLKAFGAVIGKALRSVGRGQGLIPILVALQ